jgi:hypothetical protein
VSTAREATAEARLDLANYKATAAESALLADRAERHEEARRETAKQEIVDDAKLEAEKAQFNARAAAAAADGLQQRVATLIASKRGAGANPNTPGGGSGESGPDALDLLVDVLNRHSRELVEVGGYADRLRIAGAACERAYDSLTPR